ncbi:MFS transporter [Comamonas testosteroni]|uniref:Major facilitator superfamily MFS_1 n=1 Tax=Comamonas testosteroni (strain DSM 14576 / KF-1) TaxID=399795 RepID=B7WWL4_COMTK|nr:MFS transporter [Comamonas testosteroni]EED67748.1 major facilitator superfamily MFS_1 [Comamonas testosteroni KF-1]WQG65878.1 MFS transporter [Comamonas testosteroni]
MQSDNNTQQSRNMGLLVAAQSLGGASPPIIISLGGLVGQQLSSNPAASTLPVSIYQLGLALSTLPAAWIMNRMGRRAAYVLGAVLGVISGVVAAQGIAHSDFVTFCIGTALAGFYAACVQSYRFAATDMVSEPAQQAKAISRVMIGGLIAAIIGPQVVIWTRDALPATPFAGSFYSQAALALLALPLLMGLRLPPPQSNKAVVGDARPLGEIARTPQFVVACAAGVVSYGLMAFLMTAAPMAMVGCGHSVGEAAMGIQWHVLAMFVPSFFTGKLIARYGKQPVTALGLLMIGAAGVLALMGLDIFHFWGSLILLGVGWNFGFIGATALLTECYRPSERAKVQALNDFLVFGTVAVASFGSGQLLHSAGWNGINIGMLPLVAVVLVLLGLHSQRRAKA